MLRLHWGNPLVYFAGLSLGFVVIGETPVDLYEHNQLLNLNGRYSRIFLSLDSCNSLNLKGDTPFIYWNGGQKYQRTITHVGMKESGCELVFDSAKDEPPISNVSYRIGRGNVWSEIFR